MAELRKDQLGCSSEHEEPVVRRLREESNSWEELQPPGNVAADGPDREPGAWNGKLVRLREMLHRKCP